MTTHPSQGTGYALVANKITNFLADQPGVEVVFYGFQNYKQQQVVDRFIDPRIKFYDAIEIDEESPRGFGDKGIVPAIAEEKPDVLFLYNDLPVTNAILSMIPEELRPAKTYVYLDIVYPWQNIDMYKQLKSHKIDKIITFAERWRKHMVDDLGFPTEQIDYMYHGVDFERFTEIDSKEAKKKLGIDEDDFLIVNMNRNSYRKMIPKTLESFLLFWKMNDMNPKIKMFLGCRLFADDSCDVMMTLEKICMQMKLDFDTVSNQIMISPSPTFMTDEFVNVVYNAGDVGINTCCGEGFGLTNVEHLYLNKPQIVPGIPILKEILDDKALFVKPVIQMTMFNFEKHTGDVAISSSSDFASQMDKCFKEKLTEPRGKEYVSNKYSWKQMEDKLKQIML